MTEAALRNAISSAVRHAFQAGQETARLRSGQDHGTLLKALTYAEALILPVAEVFAQEAIEQADAKRRQALAQAGAA